MGYTYADIGNSPFWFLQELYETHYWIGKENNKDKPKGKNVMEFNDVKLQFNDKKIKQREARLQ